MASDVMTVEELADYLPPDELPGIAMQFRAAFARLN